MAGSVQDLYAAQNVQLLAAHETEVDRHSRNRDHVPHPGCGRFSLLGRDPSEHGVYTFRGEAGAGLGAIDRRCILLVRPHLGSGEVEHLRQAPDVIDVVVGDDDPLDGRRAEIDLLQVGEKRTGAAREAGVDQCDLAILNQQAEVHGATWAEGWRGHFYDMNARQELRQGLLLSPSTSGERSVPQVPVLMFHISLGDERF
jgi:hypothetical protein